MSRAKHKRAAWLQAISTSSYQDPGVFLQLDANIAAAWTWDMSSVRALANVSSRQLIPETLLHEPTEGFALRQAIDGFEGQFWRNGKIILSRWWEHMPSGHQWKIFCLSADPIGAIPVPIPDLQPGLSATRSRLPMNDLPPSAAISTLGWKMGIGLLAVTLSMPATYQLARWSYLENRISSAENELRALRSEKADLRRLQSDTLLAAERLEPLTIFFQTRHPLPAMADAMSILTRLEAKVTRLDYSDQIVDVEITVVGKFEPTTLIRELEASPNIKEASIQPSRRDGQWLLSFFVDRERVQ